MGPVFIDTLWNLVKSLPESVPQASEFDKLAMFGGSPKEFDDAALDADELWETTLNGILKSALGWGTEGNMDEIVHHGKWGLDGLLNFVIYFVEERGVSEGLFEGKLTNLVLALKTVVEQDSSILNMVDSNNFQATPMLRECTKQPNEAVIIDVDVFKYEDILK